MDKVIPALIVAAISSLSYLAYKHPNAYRKIFLAIGVCFIAMTLSVTAWTLGSELTYRALIDHIESGKLKEASVAARSYQISPWTLFAIDGLYIYLFALLYLPRLLDEDEPKNK